MNFLFNLFSWISSTRNRQRIKIWQNHLLAACDVVEKTGHKEAEEVLSFLITCSFLVTPSAIGFKLIQRHRRMVVPIAILIDEHDLVSPLWEKLYKDTAGALSVTCKDGINFLLFKAFMRFTAPWLGFLVLHEGLHALLFQKRDAGNNSTDSKDRVGEELIIYQFECDLIGLYFGPVYSELITELAEKLFQEGHLTKLKRGIIQLQPSYDWVNGAYNLLKQIIGEPASEYEEQLHKKMIFIHVYFTMLKKVKEGRENLLRQLVEERMRS